MTKKAFELFTAGNYSVEPAAYYTWKWNLFPSLIEFSPIENIEELMDSLQKELGLGSENIVFSKQYYDSKEGKMDKNYYQYLLEPEEKILIVPEDSRVVLYYNHTLNSEIIEKYSSFLRNQVKSSSQDKKFYMLTMKEHGGLGLKSFKVKDKQADLDKHYNNDLAKVHDRILSFLNDESRDGMVLLYGKPGTGKTSYLRHLTSLLDKKIIYFPIHLMNEITSPSFLPFISNQANSILIIEDCEKLVQDRKFGHDSGALANLLNLSDGFLSDALNLKVICTFNAELKFIDPAILRKGRLAEKYEFKELEIEKAKKLTFDLGQERIINAPVTLAEIFSEEEITPDKNNNKRIGFSVNEE